MPISRLVIPNSTLWNIPTVSTSVSMCSALFHIIMTNLFPWATPTLSIEREGEKEMEDGGDDNGDYRGYYHFCFESRLKQGLSVCPSVGP